MSKEEVSLHTIVVGTLLVKIKGVGQTRVNTGGQSLLAYVYDAYGLLNPTVVTRQADQDLTKDWRIIQFSSKDRILEVEKVS